jgi:hypothetical protein
MPKPNFRVVGSFNIEVEAIWHDSAPEDRLERLIEGALEKLRTVPGVQYAELLDCSVAAGVDGTDYRREIEDVPSRTLNDALQEAEEN